MTAMVGRSLRKALVTGGAGFVGSHLVDRLVDDGFEVLVLDDLSSGKVARLAPARRRGAVRFHQLDLRADRLANAVERFSPELVFHLAAQTSVAASQSDPVRDAQVNILGTLNLLEACSRAGVERLVFTSTVAVYGGEAALPVRENSPLRPASPYGLSKKVAEGYLEFWRQRHGLDYAVIRPANIYGPRQSAAGESGVVAVFSRACLDRRRPTIFGSGNDTRDYVFVDDVVDALVRAADRGDGGVYNIGTAVETSTTEMFATISRLVRFGGQPVHGPPRPGDVRRSAVDWSLALHELGWQPFTTFEEGIRLTVDWFAGR